MPSWIQGRFFFKTYDSAEDVFIVNAESVFSSHGPAFEAAGAAVTLEGPGVVRAVGVLLTSLLAILGRSVQAYKIALIEVTPERPIFALPVDWVCRSRHGFGNFRSFDVTASESGGLSVGCFLSVDGSGFQPTGSAARRCPREVGARLFGFAHLETVVGFGFGLLLRSSLEVAIESPKHVPAFRLKPLYG